jgi:hypothetical protein
MLIQQVDANFDYQWFTASFTTDGAGAGNATFASTYPLNQLVAYIVRGAVTGNGVFSISQVGTGAASFWPNNQTPASLPAVRDVQMDFPADLTTFRAAQQLLFSFTGLTAATTYTFALLVQVPRRLC